MGWFLFVIVFLSSPPGTWTEAHLYEKFVLKGSSEHLTLGETQQNLTHIQWKKGNDIIASHEKGVAPKYRGKVELNKNYSLILKNLEETDSGTYTVWHGEWTLIEVVTFNLKVQEAVLRPSIDLRVLQLNLSAEGCVFSVNCSVPGSWVHSTFHPDRHEQSQHLPDGINITLAVGNGSVKCTARNHVSEEQSYVKHELCYGKIKDTRQYFKIVFGILGSIIFVVLATVIFWVCRLKNKPQLQETEIDTVYSEVNKPRSAPHRFVKNSTNQISPAKHSPGFMRCSTPEGACTHMDSTQGQALGKQQHHGVDTFIYSTVGAPVTAPPAAMSSTILNKRDGEGTDI